VQSAEASVACHLSLGADDHTRRASTDGRSESLLTSRQNATSTLVTARWGKGPCAHRYDLAGHSGCLKDNESVIFARVLDGTHPRIRVAAMRGVLLMRADPGLRAQEVFVFFLKPLITQAGFTPRVVVWSALLGVIPLLGMAFWGIPVAEEELLATVVPLTGAVSPPSRLPAADRNRRGAIGTRPFQGTGSVGGLGVAAGAANFARSEQARRNGLGGPLRL
jgi:hypothetical protein